MDGIDFLIITALEVEAKAVLQKLPNVELITERDHTYYRSTLPITKNQHTQSTYEIVVARLLGMGESAAALTTIAAIHRWSPDYIILVGTATAISKQVTPQVAPGDILIANRIIGIEVQKSLDSDNGFRESYSLSPLLLSAVHLYHDSSWKKLLAHQELVERQTKVHFGTMLSSDVVISSRSSLRGISRYWSDVIGLEMEGAGIARVTSHRTGLLVIRSVSGYADEKKDDTLISYSCDIAASFTVGFLKSGPISPRIERSTRPRVTISIHTDELDASNDSKRIISLLSDLLQIEATQIDVQNVQGDEYE